MRLFPLYNRTRFLKTGLLAALALLIFSGSVYAQVQFVENGRPIAEDRSYVLLTKSLTKHIIDLNGRWEYKSDDDASWNTVQVPSSYIGDNTVEFRRTFTVDRQLARESVFQLVALSISYYCEIRINGQFIGKHSGETSFSFKISPGIIKSGNNEISVTVQNVHNANETLPLKERLWDHRNYGGIIHDIALVANAAVWVQESAVATTISGEGRPATASFKTLLNSGTITKLEGDTASMPISFGKSVVSSFIEIIDPSTNTTVATTEPVNVTIESDRLIPVEHTITIPTARLWSPEAPNLYIARFVTMYGATLVDESFLMFGLRKVEMREGKFYLNNQPYFLKGISYVEHSARHGRSITPNEIERDILLIKNTGANAIRFSSGCVHPYYYNVCNKYGLLVFQDLVVKNVPSGLLSSLPLETSAGNTLKEMISRDGSNPCLVGWGLGQGIDQKSNSYHLYIDRLSSLLREENNRLEYATFVTLTGEALPPALDFAGIDLLSTNIDEARNQLRALKDISGTPPLFVTSLSYPVQIGNFNGHSDPRSVDAQANFFLKLYSEITDLEYPGVFIHSFSDWSVRVPIMTVDRVHQFTATAGITDMYRQKRLAYDVIKARFNNEKPPVISSGDYRPNQPVIFVIAGIIVLFVFAMVYNIFRRFRENVVRSFLRPHNFFTDIRDQRILSVFQTSVVGALGSLSSGLFITNLMYYWRTNFYVDSITSVLVQPIWLKQWLNYAAWNPFENVIVTSVLLFIILLLYSGLFRIISLFFKRNVLMFDTYSVTMWSVLPMIILAPFGMVTYRILNIPFFEFLAIAVFIVFHLWLLSRILKGTAIVLDVRPGAFMAGGFILVFAAFFTWIFMLDSSNEAIQYLSYIFNTWTYSVHFM